MKFFSPKILFTPSHSTFWTPTSKIIQSIRYRKNVVMRELRQKKTFCKRCGKSVKKYFVLFKFNVAWILKIKFELKNLSISDIWTDRPTDTVYYRNISLFKNDVPANLVAAGHREQSSALHHAVPRLSWKFIGEIGSWVI